jgi:hypothetical protein
VHAASLHRGLADAVCSAATGRASGNNAIKLISFEAAITSWKVVLAALSIYFAGCDCSKHGVAAFASPYHRIGGFSTGMKTASRI